MDLLLLTMQCAVTRPNGEGTQIIICILLQERKKKSKVKWLWLPKGPQGTRANPFPQPHVPLTQTLRIAEKSLKISF